MGVTGEGEERKGGMGWGGILGWRIAFWCWDGKVGLMADKASVVAECKVFVLEPARPATRCVCVSVIRQ